MTMSLFRETGNALSSVSADALFSWNGARTPRHGALALAPSTIWQANDAAFIRKHILIRRGSSD
jgi:hypothetical protein